MPNDLKIHIHCDRQPWRWPQGPTPHLPGMHTLKQSPSAECGLNLVTHFKDQVIKRLPSVSLTLSCLLWWKPGPCCELWRDPRARQWGRPLANCQQGTEAHSLKAYEAYYPANNHTNGLGSDPPQLSLQMSCSTKGHLGWSLKAEAPR